MTRAIVSGTCGLVAMTSAQHAEGRQFDPGQVYFGCKYVFLQRGPQCVHIFLSLHRVKNQRQETPRLRPLNSVTVAILAQGTHWAVATSQAFLFYRILPKRDKDLSSTTREHPNAVVYLPR